MSNKRQRAGDSSINIQADSINFNGITEITLKKIALEIFEQNFLKLTSVAENIAKKRAEEITNKFIKELANRNPEGIGLANDPNFQSSLYTLQKEYAKTGDKELGDLLIDILVDRTNHPERSIIQIVLNESLVIAPKLVDSQLSAISIIFLFEYTHMSKVISLQTLKEYLEIYIHPFISTLTKNATCYQHIQYTGAGSISMGSVILTNILKNNYSGIFSRGFVESDVKRYNITVPISNKIFIPCLHNPKKYQINGLQVEDIKRECRRLGVPAHEINQIVAIQNDFLMGDDAIRTYIVKTSPFMDKLFDTWEKSFMKNLSLSSVGMAIAHANIKKSLGEFTDLSTWLN